MTRTIEDENKDLELLEMFVYCLVDEQGTAAFERLLKRAQRYTSGMRSHPPPNPSHPVRLWSRQMSRHLVAHLLSFSTNSGGSKKDVASAVTPEGE